MKNRTKSAISQTIKKLMENHLVYKERSKENAKEFLHRKGKDAIAVDAVGKMPGVAPAIPREDFDTIPMWIADMNFATVPTVQEHIIERVNHPTFGYFYPTQEYFDMTAI